MLQPLFLVTDPLALLGIPVHGVVILFQVGGVTVSVFVELELCVLLLTAVLLSTLCFWLQIEMGIPDQFIGAIIGKGGESITALRKVMLLPQSIPPCFASSAHMHIYTCFPVLQLSHHCPPSRGWPSGSPADHCWNPSKCAIGTGHGEHEAS